MRSRRKFSPRRTSYPRLTPNAWLGGAKNKNLVTEFGEDGGFWALFNDGVEDIEVCRGYLRIRLRE